MRKLPREVNIGFVPNFRGGFHNVLEVCAKEQGVRYVMAQDSETDKERDKYKLRAHLQQQRIKELEQALEQKYCAACREEMACISELADKITALEEAKNSMYLKLVGTDLRCKELEQAIREVVDCYDWGTAGEEMDNLKALIQEKESE